MSSDCLYILASRLLIYIHNIYIFACLYELRAFIADRWNVDGRNVLSIGGRRRMDGWKMRKFRVFCFQPLTKYSLNSMWMLLLIIFHHLPFVHPHVKFPFSLDFCILSLYVSPFNWILVWLYVLPLSWEFSAPHFWVVLVYPLTTRVGNKINLHSTHYDGIMFFVHEKRIYSVAFSAKFWNCLPNAVRTHESLKFLIYYFIKWKFNTFSFSLKPKMTKFNIEKV